MAHELVEQLGLADVERTLARLTSKTHVVHTTGSGGSPSPVISHRHALAMQDALLKLNRQGAGKRR